MPSILTSTVTERSQTTLPRAVRTVLGLETGEQVGYVIEGDQVRLVNASTLEHDDPVLTAFLTFLGRDLAEHPERLRVFPPSLLQRAQAVTRGVAIDHDASLDGAITL